jgi:hypothetical protein
MTFNLVNDNAAIGIGIKGYTVGQINDFASKGPSLESRLEPEIPTPGTLSHIPGFPLMTLI